VSSSTLKDLTVVIPTVSRPLFVLRQFEYWGDTEVNVLILDGAADPIEIPTQLHRPNINYVHTGTRFNERMSLAATLVESRYCAYLPDDEFFLFDGLKAAMLFLDKNQDCIGCVGRNLYFFVDQDRFLVRDAYRDWAPFPEQMNTLTSRLDADLPPNKAHMSACAIMRSDAWKVMFRNAYSQFFSCGYTYERLLNLQRTVLGKTEILEDLLWMRSMENPPISDVNVPRVAGHDFVSWARNPIFASEVARYREIACGIIALGGLSQSEVEAFEHRFFVGGVHRQATKEARNRKRFSRRLGGIAMTRAPKRARMLAKRFLPNVMLSFTGWEGNELDVMCESLRKKGTRFDRADLERVRDLSLRLDRLVRN
jgi:glycosyltransferase domain-containing protein